MQDLDALYAELGNPLSWHWNVDSGGGLLHPEHHPENVEALHVSRLFKELAEPDRSKLQVYLNALYINWSQRSATGAEWEAAQVLAKILGRVTAGNSRLSEVYREREDTLAEWGFPVNDSRYERLKQKLIAEWSATMTVRQKVWLPNPSSLFESVILEHAGFIEAYGIAPYAELTVSMLRAKTRDSVISSILFEDIPACREAISSPETLVTSGTYINTLTKKLESKIGTSDYTYWFTLDFAMLSRFIHETDDIIEAGSVLIELIVETKNHACTLLSSIQEYSLKDLGKLVMYFRKGRGISQYSLKDLVILGKKFKNVEEFFRDIGKVVSLSRNKEFWTVQGLRRRGALIVHVCNAFAGGAAGGKDIKGDPFKNIENDILKKHEYSPSGSLIRQHEKGGIVNVASADISSPIGVIYDYGYIYEAYTGDAATQDKGKNKTYRTEGRGVKISSGVLANEAVSKSYNEVVLRKWSVGALFYVTGCQNDAVRRLKEISDKYSFKEYENLAYAYRESREELPREIVKVFPVFEISKDNEWKLVHVPSSSRYDVDVEERTLTVNVREREVSVS